MSAITTAIQNYRAGRMTWGDLFTFLTGRHWPQPERYKNLPEDPLKREAELDQRPNYTDGTWDEVVRARDYGDLSPQEYDSLNREMWRRNQTA